MIFLKIKKDLFNSKNIYISINVIYKYMFYYNYICKSQGYFILIGSNNCTIEIEMSIRDKI